MRAINISRFGDPEVLRVVERPLPVPGVAEVLIRVAGAGVARADVLQRQGKYGPPTGASDIPGLDVAGVIADVGPGVERFEPGDRVCAILSGGGYAEYCLAPAVQVLPTPRNWTDLEAATLPENLFTAYDAVITRGALNHGETLLVHGGSSGVGSMAIMLSRLWDATAIATAGSEAKCQACLELGAAHAINYRPGDFSARVLELTKGRGIDVVLDMVGAQYLAQNMASLAVEGRIVTIASHGGQSTPIDMALLMRKRGRVMGCTMRARTPEEKGLVAQAAERDLWPSLPSKNPIRPLIDSIFPLADAAAAHARMESGEHIGKIVLAVS